MKTANKDIDIYYDDLSKAERAFEKEEKADLLRYKRNPFRKIFFIDRSKEAIKQWPQYYELLKTK